MSIKINFNPFFTVQFNILKINNYETQKTINLSQPVLQ